MCMCMCMHAMCVCGSFLSYFKALHVCVCKALLYLCVKLYFIYVPQNTAFFHAALLDPYIRVSPTPLSVTSVSHSLPALPLPLQFPTIIILLE
jgi:hypothetical protein